MGPSRARLRSRNRGGLILAKFELIPYRPIALVWKVSLALPGRLSQCLLKVSFHIYQTSYGNIKTKLSHQNWLDEATTSAQCEHKILIIIQDLAFVNTFECQRKRYYCCSKFGASLYHLWGSVGDSVQWGSPATIKGAAALSIGESTKGFITITERDFYHNCDYSTLPFA